MGSLKYLVVLLVMLLVELHGNARFISFRSADPEHPIILSGKVTEAKTGKPIPFVNVGIFEKNIGTLSDPDGSFELTIPSQYAHDSIIFSSIGFRQRKIPV